MNANIIMEYEDFTIYEKDGKEFVSTEEGIFEVERIATLIYDPLKNPASDGIHFIFDSDFCGEELFGTNFIWYRKKEE